MIDDQELRRRFRYEPDTGRWFWRINRQRGRAGNETFKAKNRDGYRQAQVNGRYCSSARAAFLYMTGRWPLTIDHINGRRDDDRWINLREATVSEQCINRKKPSKTGHRYVFRSRRGYGIHIDGFKTITEANALADRIGRELHGRLYTAL